MKHQHRFIIKPLYGGLNSKVFYMGGCCTKFMESLADIRLDQMNPREWRFSKHRKLREAIAKIYPSEDGAIRFKRESEFLKFLQQSGIRQVPRYYGL